MKRLLVLSGKGGTGKTTDISSIYRLSRARAAADCDVDAPNLHLVMEQETEPEVTEFMGGDKAQADPDICTGCGKCEASCRFEAIRLFDGKAVVNEYACEGCGVCSLYVRSRQFLWFRILPEGENCTVEIRCFLQQR